MVGDDVPSIAEILGRPEWEERAACKGLDVELFLPPVGRSAEGGRAVCRGCEVRGDCLAVALADESLSGIWGGTSEHERLALRKKLPPPAPKPPACKNCGEPLKVGEYGPLTLNRCGPCRRFVGRYGVERRAIRKASA